MHNYFMEMLLCWARIGSESIYWTVHGYLLGAKDGTKLEPWELAYVSNVNNARMFRGISA